MGNEHDPNVDEWRETAHQRKIPRRSDRTVDLERIDVYEKRGGETDGGISDGRTSGDETRRDSRWTDQSPENTRDAESLSGRTPERG